MRGQSNYDTIRDGIKGMIVGLCVCLVLFALTFTWGTTDYYKFEKYKDTAVPVIGTVSKVKEVDDDGDTDYRVYVTYEYDGILYEDIKVATFDENNYHIGEKVQFNVAPDKPDFIFKWETGTFGSIVAILFLSIACCILTELIHKKTGSQFGDTKIITDTMIANDLKPKFGVFSSKILISISTSFVIGHYMLPNLFGEGTRNTGFVFGILALIIYILAIKSVLRIPEKEYKLDIHKCLKQWSEGSGDDTTYYTLFSNYPKVTGRYGIVGRNYYFVKNKHDRMCQLYDMEYWQPAVEDATLSQASRTIVKNLIFDFFLEIVMSGLYIAIIYYLVFGMR